MQRPARPAVATSAETIPAALLAPSLSLALLLLVVLPLLLLIERGGPPG